ncbi:MAG: SBBP repeat-containing protein [Ginsengibacter sp.]
MNRIIITTSLLLILSAPSLFAQQQDIVRYNGTGNGMDEIKDMVIDGAGNVYVTGYADMGASYFDYITIKYNTNGEKQWKARYNGTGNGSDIPNAIFVDANGNVYVTGASNRVSGAIFDLDATTIKYSPQGVQLWVMRYDDASHKTDGGNDVIVDAAGNVYITGYATITHGSSYARKDYLTIEYSASGAQLWLATFNGPVNNADDEAIGLGLDTDGNIYVSGTSFAGNDPDGEDDYLTIKYNPQGVQQWTARYNGPVSEPDHATAMTVDKAGNSYVTGYSQGISTDFDYATVKYNSNGVQQWVERYNGAENGFDIPYDIAVDNSGNVYVTGSAETSLYNSDYSTIKYNSAGQQQWNSLYDGSGKARDEAHGLALDKNGNVYVTGYTTNRKFEWDIASVMYSSSGIKQAVRIYNGPKDSADVGNVIALDASGNVYIAGASTGRGTAWDFTVIKYSVSGGAPDPATNNTTAYENLIQHSQQSFGILQISPNPVKEVANIRFHIATDNKIKLMIYDANGNRVTVLKDGELKAGTYEAQWNTGNSLPGVYYCKLIGKEMQDVKRIVISR